MGKLEEGDKIINLNILLLAKVTVLTPSYEGGIKVSKRSRGAAEGGT